MRHARKATLPPLLLCLAAHAACSDDPVDTGERIYAASCQVRAGASQPPKLKLSRVLSRTAIAHPVQMLPAPGGTERVFLVSQPGYIYVADKVTDMGAATQWLDIKARVESGPNEAGLLGLAFDPAFATNGRFYVDYTRRLNGQLQTIISRFVVPAPPLGPPDPRSESILLIIDQPYDNHNGGQLAFGPDGMLYIGMGDGGSGGDPQNNGQSLAVLLGKILRIDVSSATGYRVPPDNPFAGKAGSRGEIWAYGLRNPWRFSFDPMDGTLWAGDVGQDSREEIDIIEKGRNYGWRLMEGTRCFNPTQGCQHPDLVLPVADYDHAEGKSVTGGHRYRGGGMPALYGTYVFADFVSGTVWGLVPGQNGAWTRSTLIEQAGSVSAFGLDSTGEIYILDWMAGTILKVSQADPAATPQPGWPQHLSDTGCFSDLSSRTLVRGVLRYQVNAPLWSDGAAKERGLVLPPGTTIGFTESGTWDLPLGTILIKTFLLGERPVETRFLVSDRGDTGTIWRGATYRWNDQGTDGYLLLNQLSADIAGQSWYFPSRADCVSCHTRASGQVLGLSTVQLNREADLFGSGKTHPQIDAMAQLGYFTSAPSRAQAELPSLPAPDDESAPLPRRARAYLHANCAHCHMPGGLADATIDLREGTPLSETRACGVAAQQGDLGVRGAQIISPGQPDKSTLYLRMATLDPTVRMPNLATRIADTKNVELVKAWISGMASCQGE